MARFFLGGGGAGSRASVWSMQMKIIDDFIDTLNPKAKVRDIRQGPFRTAVHTRNCVLAPTPHTHVCHQDHAPIKGVRGQQLLRTLG